MSYEELEERLKKVEPSSSLERGIFNDQGEIIIRLTIPGKKVIEVTNVNALSVVVSNLEAQKRQMSRPQ